MNEGGPKENPNRFEISLQGKISLWCKSTFTWDPKWTQTGLKSQTTLKCRSVYMVIYMRFHCGNFPNNSKTLLHMCKWYFLINANLINAKKCYQWYLLIDASLIQFIIFNPWKVPWNWIAFYQNSFVMPPGLLYQLIRCNSGQLVNEAFTSNPTVYLKRWLNGLKITNWINAKHKLRYCFF